MTAAIKEIFAHLMKHEVRRGILEDGIRPDERGPEDIRLRIFDVAIPVVTSAMALAIIATYSITEEKAHEIRTELESRRGKISA